MSDYRKPEKLLALYAWMKDYFDAHQRHATNLEVVEAGFTKTTSCVRYMYDAMTESGMMEREYGVARGVYLNTPNKWTAKMRDLADTTP